MQLKEGQIEEGSPAWQAMSAADRTKRKRAAAEARTKLKSPNYFLSRTRLCLRNLPPKLSEKGLKDLVLAAVSPHRTLLSLQFLGMHCWPPIERKSLSLMQKDFSGLVWGLLEESAMI